MMGKWWKVEVSDDSGQIVVIEPRMLAGREPTDADEKIIEDPAFNLLGFIGYGFGTVEFQAGALAMREQCTARADYLTNRYEKEVKAGVLGRMIGNDISTIDPATLGKEG